MIHVEEILLVWRHTDSLPVAPIKILVPRYSPRVPHRHLPASQFVLFFTTSFSFPLNFCSNQRSPLLLITPMPLVIDTSARSESCRRTKDSDHLPCSARESA